MNPLTLVFGAMITGMILADPALSSTAPAPDPDPPGQHQANGNGNPADPDPPGQNRASHPDSTWIANGDDPICPPDDCRSS